MRWKFLMALLLILGVAWLLYFKPLPIKLKLPTPMAIMNLVKKPSYFSNFSILFRTSKQTLSGEEFKLINVNLTAKGICSSVVNLGENAIDLANQPCEITLSSPDGKLSVTEANSIIVESKFSAASINGLRFYSTKPISFEILPEKFIAGITFDSANLEVQTGSLEKIKSGGISESVYFPPNQRLELYNFIGTLRLIGTTASLNGVVSGLRYS